MSPVAVFAVPHSLMTVPAAMPEASARPTCWATPELGAARMGPHLSHPFFVAFELDSETVVSLNKPDLTYYFFCHLLH